MKRLPPHLLIFPCAEGHCICRYSETKHKIPFPCNQIPVTNHPLYKHTTCHKIYPSLFHPYLSPFTCAEFSIYCKVMRQALITPSLTNGTCVPLLPFPQGSTLQESRDRDPTFNMLYCRWQWATLFYDADCLVNVNPEVSKAEKRLFFWDEIVFNWRCETQCRDKLAVGFDAVNLWWVFNFHRGWGRWTELLLLWGMQWLKPCLVAFLAMTMKGTAIWEKNGCVVAFISADLMTLTNLHHPLGWLLQPKLHSWTSNKKCWVIPWFRLS